MWRVERASWSRAGPRGSDGRTGHRSLALAARTGAPTIARWRSRLGPARALRAPPALPAPSAIGGSASEGHRPSDPTRKRPPDPSRERERANDWRPSRERQRAILGPRFRPVRSKPRAPASESPARSEDRTQGFLVAFDYTDDVLREIDVFFRKSAKVIVGLTVREILDEQLAKKLA